MLFRGMGWARPRFLYAMVMLGAAVCAVPAFAQGGPPLLTTDPVTPGPENLEINLGVMPILRNNTKLVQIPQIDINYGVGEDIQFTVYAPFEWQAGNGMPDVTGWSNVFTGVKWHFLDHGENGFNISMFPQIEIRGSQASQRTGIADPGTRLELPLEFSRKVGPLEMNLECGYYIPLNSPRTHNERFIGLALGHDFTKKLEGIGETYNDWVLGAPPKDTFFDAGFRYAIRPSFIFLFMAGRSFSPNSSGQPEFLAYAGMQILLDKNGRSLHHEK